MATLATVASASAIDSAIQRKMHERGVVWVGKGIASVISEEDRNDVIKTILK